MVARRRGCLWKEIAIIGLYKTTMVSDPQPLAHQLSVRSASHTAASAAQALAPASRLSFVGGFAVSIPL
jgi:hypothetical protein